MTTCLLSTTYFGPVQWYQKLYRYERAEVECMENFQKQSYRNRCVIAATDGPLTLTVPVTHDGDKTLTRDIKVSSHGNWRHLHWNAIRSAYNNSPFYEYYADDLRPLFEREWTYLLDLNEAITETLCPLLDIDTPIGRTHEYAAPGEALADDFRSAIHPKHPLPDPTFVPKPYYQVFAQRHGFLPNMSILDLLFNQGNESPLYL